MTRKVRVRLELEVDPDVWADNMGMVHTELGDDVADYVLELVEVSRAHASGAMVASSVRAVKR